MALSLSILFLEAPYSATYSSNFGKWYWIQSWNFDKKQSKFEPKLQICVSCLGNFWTWYSNLHFCQRRWIRNTAFRPAWWPIISDEMDETDNSKLPISLKRKGTGVPRLAWSSSQLTAQRHVFQKSIYSDWIIFFNNWCLLRDMHGHNILGRHTSKNKCDKQQVKSTGQIHISNCPSFWHHIPTSATFQSNCVQRKLIWLWISVS